MPKSSNKYFKRLLITFIAISIIPLSLCIGVIICLNIVKNDNEYNKEAKLISDSGVKQVDHLLGEYRDIVVQIAGSEILKNALADNDPDKIIQTDVIQTIMIGREGTIEIHLFDYDSSFSYGTNIKPNIYEMSVYRNWGIFYDMSAEPSRLVLFPNSYTTNPDKKVCISMGKAILGDNNQIVGFVVIDIYRNEIINKLITSGSDTVNYILLDNKNRILLDTSSLYGEGYRINKAQKEEWKSGKLSLPLEKNSKIFVAAGNSDRFDFSLFSFMIVTDYNRSTAILIEISLITAAVAMTVCFVMAEILARRLYNPINVIVEYMGEITNGNLKIRMEEKDNSNDEITILAKGFNQMLDYINYLMEKVVEQTKLQKNAEMKALQAQISPHFLYNMLNEIKALAKMRRTEDIVTFVVNLGTLLRLTISNRDDFVTVEEDLVFINAYLELQKIRYENSYEVILDIHEEILNCKILKLILQPIIENAIIHGIDSSRTDQYIKISGYRENDMVIFEILDNGIGIDEEYMQYINNTGSSAGLYGGQGIENVKKRLMLTYGEKYGLRIESKKGAYTKVIVTIPYEVDR